MGTGAKSFADNGILGSRALNEHGLHVGRLKLAHRLAASRRRRLAAAVPAEWRAQFDRDGFVEIRDFLPADTFARLQRELLDTAFDSRQHQQGSTVTRRVAVDSDLLEASPAVRPVIEAGPWRALLAYIASTSAEPLYYIQTIVTGAPSADPDPQLELHADTFHPSLKAWLFLTDVTDDQGPLTYVAGSHLPTPKRLAWEKSRSVGIENHDRLSQRGSLRISPDELAGLDLPPPTRFAVPANTLVAIDTFGFHARGSSTRPTVRAELWAYVRRNPFLPYVGLDLFSLPWLGRWRADVQYWVVDRLDRLDIKQQHWHPAGRKRPTER